MSTAFNRNELESKVQRGVEAMRRTGAECLEQGVE